MLDMRHPHGRPAEFWVAEASFMLEMVGVCHALVEGVESLVFMQKNIPAVVLAFKRLTFVLTYCILWWPSVVLGQSRTG